MSRDYLAEKKNSIRSASKRIMFLKERVAKDMKEAEELSAKVKRDEATVKQIEDLEAEKEKIKSNANISRDTFVHMDKQAAETILTRMQSVNKDLEEVDARIRVVFYGK